MMTQAAPFDKARIDNGPRRPYLRVMDAHLFRRFCEALLPRLEGARLEKIQALAPDILTFVLYGQKKKALLCLRFGRKEPFLFLTRNPVASGVAPPAWVMRLRKYAAGRRIGACVAQFWSRRLWLLMGRHADLAGRLVWLLLDLREGASLHFLTESETPQTEAVDWPAAAQLEAACQDWRRWPMLTPALRRALPALDLPERLALLEDLRAGGGDVFLYAGEDGRVRAISAWPLPDAGLRGWREEAGAEVLNLFERAGQELALARLAREVADRAAAPGLRRRRRLEALLAKLDAEECRLRKMCAARADALALQQNLWRWPPGLRAGEIELPESPGCPARALHLDARLTVTEAMEKLFHTAGRGKRGFAHLAERRRALRQELAALTADAPPAMTGAAPAPAERVWRGAAALARTLPRKVQGFCSSDGFALLRGRDAKGNLEARKLAAPHDLWLHVADGPGAHVIIRRDFPGQAVPERTLAEAGALAVLKSWQHASAKAKVMYAEVRHVRSQRNSPVGTVRVDRVLMTLEVPVDAGLEERLASSCCRVNGGSQAPGPPASGQDPAGASSQAALPAARTSQNGQ